jgi:hypothetical protein
MMDQTVIGSNLLSQLKIYYVFTLEQSIIVIIQRNTSYPSTYRGASYSLTDCCLITTLLVLTFTSSFDSDSRYLSISGKYKSIVYRPLILLFISL